MRSLTPYLSGFALAFSMAFSAPSWPGDLLDYNPEFGNTEQLDAPDSVVEVRIDRSKTLMTIPARFYGINIHPGSSKYEFARPELLRALKPDAVRIMTLMRADWPPDRSGRKLSPISRGPALFDWSELDLLVDNIVSVGAEPYLALGFGPPSWLSGAPAEWVRWPPPRARIPEYADFMATIVERYATQKSAPIRRVTVDNEPENVGYSIEDYMSLVRLAKLRIKERAPHVEVGGPAIGYAYWPQPARDRLSFAKATAEFAQSDTPFDFYDWHIYSVKPEPVLRTVDTVKQEYGSRIPLVLSEINRDWRYGGPARQKSQENNTGWASVAWLAYLYDHLQLAGVDQVFYFAWRENTLGLVSADSSQLRPNFYLFAALTNSLGRTRLLASSTHPAIGCIATETPAGKVTALLYNRADKAISVQAQLGAPIRSVHAFDKDWYMSHSRVNPSPSDPSFVGRPVDLPASGKQVFAIPRGGFVIIRD